MQIPLSELIVRDERMSSSDEVLRVLMLMEEREGEDVRSAVKKIFLSVGYGCEKQSSWRQARRA
jgi:hypothetical protein